MDFTMQSITESIAVFVNLSAFYNQPVKCDLSGRILLEGHTLVVGRCSQLRILRIH